MADAIADLRALYLAEKARADDADATAVRYQLATQAARLELDEANARIATNEWLSTTLHNSDGALIAQLTAERDAALAAHAEGAEWSRRDEVERLGRLGVSVGASDPQAFAPPPPAVGNGGPAYIIRWPHKGDPPAPGTPDSRLHDYNAWLERVSDGACVFEDGRLQDAPEDLTLGRDLSALVDELNALAAGFPDPPLPTSRG